MAYRAEEGHPLMTGPNVPPPNTPASTVSIDADSFVNTNGSGPAVEKKQMMRELGTSGLKRHGGMVYEEFLRDLQGDRFDKVIREMANNDPTVGAILFAIEYFLRRVEWRVDPASPDPADEEGAQFVRECMDDMSHTWADFISEVITMLANGWAYHELCYKKRLGEQEEGAEDELGDPLPSSRYNDGRIGWRKIPLRAQESLDHWEFDDGGGIQGMYQRAAPKYDLRYVPIEKALLFRTSSRKNNPQGQSVLRNAYRPWYFKRRIEEIEAVGIERDLAGLPMVTLPADLLSSSNANDIAIVQSFRELVTRVKNDEQTGILFPQAWDREGHELYKFELVTTGGTRMFDTGAIIERYDRRIAMTVLADWVLLGQDSVGSFALATSKTSMFQHALSAWLDNIAEVVNRYAIPRLFKLNGMATDKLPVLNHEEVQATTLEDLTGFITAMTGAGWADILTDKEIRNYLLKRAQLPQEDDDTEGGRDGNDPEASDRITEEGGPDGKAKLVWPPNMLPAPQATPAQGSAVRPRAERPEA